MYRRPIAILVLFIVITAMFVLLLPFLPGLLGYYVTTDDIGLAKFLVAKQLPASGCNNLINFDIFGPDWSEKRMGCVSEYARIAKNPSVCDLLMPSQYGLDCVAGATQEEPCWFGAYGSVQWTNGESTLKGCQRPIPQRSLEGDQCCIIDTIGNLRSANDCSSLASSQAMHDECQHELAFKHHDPSACTSIQNENIRSACKVEAQALKQNPSICRFCTPPVDRIEDVAK